MGLKCLTGVPRPCRTRRLHLASRYLFRQGRAASICMYVEPDGGQLFAVEGQCCCAFGFVCARNQNKEAISMEFCREEKLQLEMRTMKEKKEIRVRGSSLVPHYSCSYQDFVFECSFLEGVSDQMCAHPAFQAEKIARRRIFGYLQLVAALQVELHTRSYTNTGQCSHTRSSASISLVHSGSMLSNIPHQITHRNTSK